MRMTGNLPLESGLKTSEESLFPSLIFCLTPSSSLTGDSGLGIDFNGPRLLWRNLLGDQVQVDALAAPRHESDQVDHDPKDEGRKYSLLQHAPGRGSAYGRSQERVYHVDRDDEAEGPKDGDQRNASDLLLRALVGGAREQILASVRIDDRRHGHEDERQERARSPVREEDAEVAGLEYRDVQVDQRGHDHYNHRVHGGPRPRVDRRERSRKHSVERPD